MTAYDELYAYTMGRPGFILQHVVDAHGAQSATSGVDSIRLVFSLAGLYLHLEKGFNGTQVQNAHRVMGRTKRVWPTIALPENRGAMTPAHVLERAPGRDRDDAVDDWCRSVWDAFASSRPAILALLQEYRLAPL